MTGTNELNEIIMVSISCLAYNHAKYIRRCLDGFIMQQTDFKFEVLIHDDASTDGTQDIIREYEEKYPDIIKPIYQTENQYSKREVSISFTFQYPRVKGKYIAFCEGDDYWTDPLKLQKQFDTMEQNPDCVFCTHKVNMIKNDGTVMTSIPDEKYHIKTGKNYSAWHDMLFCETDWLFQTSSYFIKSNIIVDYLKDHNEFLCYSKMGDLKLHLMYFLSGNIFYIDEHMSNYRRFTENSYSSTIEANKSLKCKEYINHSDIYMEYNKFTNYKYESEINFVLLYDNFKMLRVQEKYKELLLKKYRRCFNRLNYKDKASVIMHAFLPKKTADFIESTLKKAKKRLIK